MLVSRIFKTLFNILLILIIIILSAYFVLRITDIVKIFNVETGSMEDKIHTGDYLLLCRKNEYHVGDIVTYKVDDYYITHRIIEIKNDKIITKGDANNTIDAEANISQIEGKAIYWGGYLNIIINYKFVIIAFLVSLYLLSCYFEDGKDKVNAKIEINQDEPKEVLTGDESQKEKTKDNLDGKEIQEGAIEEKVLVEPLKEDSKLKETTNKNNKGTNQNIKNKTKKAEKNGKTTKVSSKNVKVKGSSNSVPKKKIKD